MRQRRDASNRRRHGCEAVQGAGRVGLSIRAVASTGVQRFAAQSWLQGNWRAYGRLGARTAQKCSQLVAGGLRRAHRMCRAFPNAQKPCGRSENPAMLCMRSATKTPGASMLMPLCAPPPAPGRTQPSLQGTGSMAAAMSLQQGRSFFGSTRPFAAAPKKAVAAHAAPVQAAIVASEAACSGVAWQCAVATAAAENHIESLNALDWARRKAAAQAGQPSPLLPLVGPPAHHRRTCFCSAGPRQEVGAHGAEQQRQAAAGAHARAAGRHRQGAEQAYCAPLRTDLARAGRLASAFLLGAHPPSGLCCITYCGGLLPTTCLNHVRRGLECC